MRYFARDSIPASEFAGFPDAMELSLRSIALYRPFVMLITAGESALPRLSVPMKLNCKILLGALAGLACIFSFATTHADSHNDADEALAAAICPIVYPVDQSPSNRGYHYLFYGNGFFINEQGYMLTAAHVLSQLHGGQPYILLRQAAGPPQFVRAAVVMVDKDHDVAILRATPNPFGGKFIAGFLPLAHDWLLPGQEILVAARHPYKPLDAYTLETTVEDRSLGEVFDFPFSQLDKGRSDTELFLFNHRVQLGQSGAPVVSALSHGVVGLIEGQWLHPSSASIPKGTGEDRGVGAAVPIHYAIALLKQKEITWHTTENTTENTPETSDRATDQANGFAAPRPLSLVACRFPAQALFGGEVVLDALIDAQGRLIEIRVVRGTSPFLEKVLSTVQSWSFYPARLDGQEVPARIGIAFQFSQPQQAARAAPAHRYDEPMKIWADRGAVPVFTVEPLSPITSERDGNVILYESIGPQGRATAVKVFRDSETLATAALTAVNQWRFVPGRRGGSDSDSTEIVVLAIRHVGETQLGDKTK
jgi:TonB family protein